ncbi:hypothetical protein PV10_07029 [Exophiala mesophila]|uniref:MYND-type domain-containing protein n=1 Tax=Exophiala mesophila TaxID=212818 RepID=A0A0D1ZS84_EXOME|nr:uncharacterized protein PV10_07029 [Exophiala mesophila]KIV89643.1 hypothetical protein PV10_07029 [Exophiala mesophila]
MAPSTKTFPQCGATYIARLEHEFMHGKGLSVCANCFTAGLQKSLKRCSACTLVDYCSRECQKAHWSKHKAFCHLAQGKGSKSAYLTSHERDEVSRILIDCYRLRVETDHSSREEDHGIYYPGKSIDGLVWAKGDVVADFQRFLDFVETAGILPKWWTFEDRMNTLAWAINKEDPECVYKPIDQTEIITRYGGDIAIRHALIILAELCVGYDGKGPAKDDTWYEEFQEFLDLHPEERARLIGGSIAAVEAALDGSGGDASELMKQIMEAKTDA